MSRRTDPLLADVLTTIHKSAQTGKHSSLYIWMQQHHDELVRAMDSGIGHAGWEKLIAQFTEAGLTNRSGEPLTVHTARKTWWRVRKGMAAKVTPQPSQEEAFAFAFSSERYQKE